jgi:hypothetical protein
MIYKFYDKGVQIGEQDEKCLADAEAKQGVKVGGDITYINEDSGLVKPKKERKKKESTKPAKEKASKGWQYFILEEIDKTSTSIPVQPYSYTGPMNKAAFDVAKETYPDLTKIKAFTGRELKLSRKTIVH